MNITFTWCESEVINPSLSDTITFTAAQVTAQQLGIPKVGMRFYYTFESIKLSRTISDCSKK